MDKEEEVAVLNPTEGCGRECSDCPMATKKYSPGGEYGWNMGCLPGYEEASKWYAETGKSWACHANNRRPCGGFLNRSWVDGVEVSAGGLITEDHSLEDIYDGIE